MSNLIFHGSHWFIDPDAPVRVHDIHGGEEWLTRATFASVEDAQDAIDDFDAYEALLHDMVDETIETVERETSNTPYARAERGFADSRSE